MSDRSVTWCARREAPVLPFPGMGLEVRILLSSADSMGEQCVTEFAFSGAFRGPPMHWHGSYSETFIALEGQLTLLFPDREQPLDAGDVAFVPLGVAHTYRVDGDGLTRFLLICSAGSNFDAYAREASALAMQSAREALPVSEELLRTIRGRYETYEVERTTD